MTDLIFSSFLQRQQREGAALAETSDVLRLMPVDGEPPDRYVAEFQAKGLVRNRRGEIVEATGFAVMVWFPPDYLRNEHVDVPQVLTYLGPHACPWHPNIRPPFICVDIKRGMSLVEILYACFEVWTWNLYSTRDEGLNHAASQWARQQNPKRFPIDRRPLKRRTLDFEVKDLKGTGAA